MSADGAPKVEATVEIMFADYEAQLTADLRTAIAANPPLQRLVMTAWRLGWNAGYLDADGPRPVTANPFPDPGSVFSACRHLDSLHGRCADCGMSWAEQARVQSIPVPFVCSCLIERPGTARECRILDRSCPVHGTAAEDARMRASS